MRENKLPADLNAGSSPSHWVGTVKGFMKMETKWIYVSVFLGVLTAITAGGKEDREEICSGNQAKCRWIVNEILA